MSSTDLAARLARLSPEQRAQLLARLRQAAAPSLPPLTPRSADAGALPLSFAQQRLWFLAQLDPDDTSYHICRTLELRGPLDVGALAAALEALVHRHEALRTTFRSIEGQPTQHISAPTPLALPLTDLGAHPPAEREARRQQIIHQLARRPFDLAHGPLVRTHLVRLEPALHALVLGMHHIVMDGWSLGVLFDELAALYGARLRGEPAALPALAVQSADHALWERSWLRGPALDEQLAYWRGQLASAPPRIDLGIRPRPARSSRRGTHCVVRLPLPPARAVTALARDEGASDFMALFSAFVVLLHLTTGEDDLVVGTPIARRTRPETERLIGYFANTLALRVRVAPRASFRALLRHVRSVCLDAYAHQDVPFEKLVEALMPPRDPAYQPIFQLMFQLEDSHFAPRPLPGLDVRLVPEDTGASQYDASVGLAWRFDALVADAQYSTDLFDDSEVRRLLEQLGRVIELVAADPDRPVRDLRPALLGRAERAALFDEPARCVTWEPRGPGVVAQIERSMARTPDAPAILSDAGSVDYRALDARSAALATLLRRRGVGPDRTVAVVAERGAMQVIAFLAVLRAGGAYVPIKPDLPDERIGWMLDETRPVVILCDGPPPAALGRHASAIVRLDEDGSSIADAADTAGSGDAEARTPATIAVPPDALAYIIYTSGSTGRPKGVMVTRRGFDAQLGWMQHEYRLAARDRVLQLASAMFDFSVIEMFWPLMVGAAVVLPRPDGEIDPGYLAQIARAHGATVVHFVPSLLRAVIEACRATPWPTIEQVFCGGEALALDLVRDCPRVFPRAVIHNQYGPTETTINATYWRCDPADTSVPIGRPVGDTTSYVLDDDLAPVPPGGVGQLWIGGVQLARGYLHRPGLTAERFRPNPFAARPGERIYHTGDLVRQRPDGVLDYLGRVDFQVKVRGFRIELGEIEAVLQDHPQVRAALVVVRDDGPGHASTGTLVAYVCPSGSVAPAALQGFLATRLPGYMIPSAFVLLDELPRTPSGKIDRKALPAPGSDAYQRTAYAAPATPMQHRLAEIWREVLGVDQVGLHDNFFALGGHSLLVVRTVARIRAQLGAEVSVRTVFEAPTVAALAGRVEACTAADRLPPIVPVGRDQALPLSLAQQRIWFLQRLEGGSAYNIPVALRLRGALDPAALERALTAVVARHEVLRTAFPERDGQPVQQIHAAARVAIPVVDVSALGPEAGLAEARRRADDDARRPFDLDRGPPWRAAVVRLGPEDWALLLCLHHIVADGGSMPILMRELAAGYDHARRGGAGPVPVLEPLAVQYADVATWQQVYLVPRLAPQLAYWRHQLAGAPPALELPTDRPRPAMASFAGASVGFALDAAVTESLEALGRAYDATLFMVLESAWAVLLGRYSRQDRVVVGAPVAQRSQAALEPLIGMFVNTLALHNDLTGPRFADVLRRGREMVLGAFEHQDLPFEQLVEAIEPVRDLGRNPVFQTVFTLEHERAATPTLAGLDVAWLHGEHDPGAEVSKFDLSLRMTRVPDGVEAAIIYSTALFDRASIAGMACQLAALLRAVAAAPEAALDALAGPDDAERAQLAAWNATEVAPVSGCLHERIAAQAARTPDHVAVIFEGEQRTYAELLARANQLAHHLRRHGVGPDVIVAVLLERSVELVVALLGILQAGGAYLALDPDHPAERLAFAVRDAGAPVLLTSCALASRPGAHGARVVRLDTDEAVLANEPTSTPVTACTAAHLAYVLYTSGSTGTPKGVENHHRGIVNRLDWHQRQFALAPGDRVLHKTPYTFDVSVWELFWPLMVGATLVVARPEGHREPRYLAEVMARQRITCVHFVPSMLRAFVEELGVHGAQRWPDLRWLLCSGEALSAELVTLASARLGPETELHNLYGPTETAVDVTHQRCRPDGGLVSIGRPVANTQIHVVDAGWRQVPIGVPGELCIGGVQVARGYLRRPGLTADRFVPDPFSTVPGARMYRTGDLARYRATGELEFLGRLDHQVKLRGLRIELGEIEAALREVDGLRDAVVIVRDERLAAYVTGEPGPAATLRAQLASRLPAYMVPDSFTALAAFPLTASGKLDRRALPAPDDAHHAAAYVAPSTPTQKVLAAIWREVLGVDRIGIHDSFFALGGNSLLVVRLVAHINRRLGVELSARSVFEGPTIAELARRVVRIRGAGATDEPAERALIAEVAALSEPDVAAQLAMWSSVQLEIRPSRVTSALAGSRRELADRLIAQHRIDAHPSEPLARRTSPTAPATVAQQLQWDFHQRGNFPTLSIHATAFAIRGPLDVPAIQQAIADLVERQAALRTVFVLDDGRLSHTAQPHGPALDVVDLSRLPADAATAEARQRFEAISRPHDLGREVFRAQLVRRDDGDHLLLLAPHHIALDGFSWGVLTADLAALYRARTGADATLAPLELACSDFCFWQRSLEDRPVGRAQLAFWDRAVAGYAGLELPGDRRTAARGAVGLALDTYEAATVPFVLDGPRWTAIERLCARLDCTPYVAITSGFLLLLSRWSGCADVCVQSGHFHRNRPGSEAVIGNFVTPYPLRVAFDEGDSLEAAMRCCRHRVLAHREHGHVAPCSALASWPAWSRYNVNYSIDAHGDGALDLGAASVERLPWSAHARRTPHDLALFVRQGPRGARGDLVYNAERFSPALLARAAARLDQLIDLIATEPSHRVGALPRAP